MSYLEAIYSDYRSCSPDFIHGIELLKQRSITDASQCFQKALAAEDNHGLYRNKYASYCGFASILNGDSNGLYYCREAARREKNDGDVFLNLARAEWFYKNRKNTVDALLRGLQVDKGNQGLTLMLQRIGMRRRNIIPFLSRNNWFNQFFGKFIRNKRQG